MNDITYAVSVDVNNPIIPYNVYVASVLDSNVRYLEITLYQNGNVITLSNTATATASLVTDDVLIDDSVECTISNSIITVPLEDLQRHGNLDVQVTVTEGTKVLAIPFPIQVRVTPNIAENAQIDENSLGSYAEVVHEISEARGSYTNLKDRLDHIGRSDISDEIKEALLACFEHVAWIDGQGQQYYDNLRDALYASKTVISISAAFEQGSAVIYDTATLDDLKQYLTVTAMYDDGTSGVITTYTLSGTLTAGTSTITVSYGGQTATFDVSVTHYFDPDLLYTLPSTFVSTGTNSIDTGVSLVKEEEYTIFGTCTITQLTKDAKFVFGTHHGDSNDFFSICCSNIPQGQTNAGSHLWGNGIAFGTDTNFIADNDTVKFVSVVTSTSSTHQRTTYAKNVTKSTSLSGTKEYQNVTAFKGYNVFLGAQQTVGTNGFIGSISDFSIVNRIATQAEIDAYLGA